MADTIKRHVHCGDCGWKGVRTFATNSIGENKRCPKCGSRSIYWTQKP